VCVSGNSHALVTMHASIEASERGLPLIGGRLEPDVHRKVELKDPIQRWFTALEKAVFST
jgi:hypothetical protein